MSSFCPWPLAGRTRFFPTMPSFVAINAASVSMTALASPWPEGLRQSHIVIQEKRIREPKASVIGIPKGFRNKRANLRSHRAGRCNPELADHVGCRRLRYGSCRGRTCGPDAPPQCHNGPRRARPRLVRHSDVPARLPSGPVGKVVCRSDLLRERPPFRAAFPFEESFDANRRGNQRLNTTLPDSPDSIASKPFWKSSKAKRWVMTGLMSRPERIMASILYQVSKISRP